MYLGAWDICQKKNCMGHSGYKNEVDVMCMNDLFVSSIASQKLQEKNVCYK